MNGFFQKILLGVSLVSATAGAAETTGSTLRVLTYNIHHGEGIDGKLDVKRIADVINDAKADLVALQEVDRGVKRTAQRDLPAELAALTGLTVKFENNYPFQGGEYGNALLTRFPVKQTTNTRYRQLRPGEQRGVLQLVLDVHGRDVLFMGTHTNYYPDDTERLSNVAELKQIATAAGKMPIILCGDFNDVPQSHTHAALKTFLTDSWEVVGVGPGLSSPTEKPKRRIDYIWVSPPSLEPVKIDVLKSEASDHLPVLAEVRLK